MILRYVGRLLSMPLVTVVVYSHGFVRYVTIKGEWAWNCRHWQKS
jgi:hypothetical protein